VEKRGRKRGAFVGGRGGGIAKNYDSTLYGGEKNKEGKCKQRGWAGVWMTLTTNRGPKDLKAGKHPVNRQNSRLWVNPSEKGRSETALLCDGGCTGDQTKGKKGKLCRMGKKRGKALRLILLKERLKGICGWRQLISKDKRE